MQPVLSVANIRAVDVYMRITQCDMLQTLVWKAEVWFYMKTEPCNPPVLWKKVSHRLKHLKTVIPMSYIPIDLNKKCNIHQRGSKLELIRINTTKYL